MDVKTFYSLCAKNGIEWAKAKLREWVDNGQPDDFCSGYTSRAMCRVASNAITGDDPDFPDYFGSKYGTDIYMHMWRFNE